MVLSLLPCIFSSSRLTLFFIITFAFVICGQSLADDRIMTIDKEYCLAVGMLNVEPYKYIKDLDMIAVAKVNSNIIKNPEFGFMMVKADRCYVIPLVVKRKNENEIYMTVIMDVGGFEPIFLASDTVYWYLLQ